MGRSAKWCLGRGKTSSGKATFSRVATHASCWHVQFYSTLLLSPASAISATQQRSGLILRLDPFITRYGVSHDAGARPYVQPILS
jgi:hypothetical protein